MEILFRGKSKETGKWVEGYYVAYEKETYIFEQAEVNKGIDFGGYLDCCKMSEVVPETVGRYTGLTDKNGTKIFEDDIIKHYNRISFDDFESHSILLVYWGDSCCRFRNKDIKGGGQYNVSKECCYEVIGNIHDNPELLN